MKTSLRYIVPFLSFSVALPAFAAEAGAKPDESKKDSKARKEIRVITTTEADHVPGQPRIMRRVGGPAETETVTFLGIETGPVSPTLAAQLGLNEGSGLVVTQLVPDSPAAGVLKQHDILLKLDDQILIEQRQLSVLVRGHKEGDEVTVTYLRAGKQATAKVKLAKHDVPKMSMMMFNQSMPSAGGMAFGARTHNFPSGAGAGNFDIQVLPSPDLHGNRDEVNRVLSLIDGANVPGQRRINIMRPEGPGDRNISVTVNTGNSRIVSDDDKGSIELTIRDGKKHLVAKDPKGEQIFAGPVTTPEERKALPDDLRERLEKLEDMKQFSFKTDGDFKGAETKIIRPRGQGISLPSRSPAPAQRPPLFF
jgi:serine protease Do